MCVRKLKGTAILFYIIEEEGSGAHAVKDDKKANRRRMKRETMRLLYSVVTNFTVNKVPSRGRKQRRIKNKERDPARRAL